MLVPKTFYLFVGRSCIWPRLETELWEFQFADMFHLIFELIQSRYLKANCLLKYPNK